MIHLCKSVISMAACILVAFSISAQEEKIILYNSNPVKVELEGDKIKSFVGEAPKSYMKGYELARKSVNPLMAIATPTTPVDSKKQKNAEYPILDQNSLTLKYKANFALLNKSVIDQLNDVAVKLRQNPNMKILLTAFRVTGKPTSTKLSENRIKSAISYLKIKGISESRVQKETQITDTVNMDNLLLNYLR